MQTPSETGDEGNSSKRPTTEQRIAEARDRVWRSAKESESTRWAEVVTLPETERFFTIRPQWFIRFPDQVYQIPYAIAQMIEGDYARKKTSLDIPASPALRFGRCVVDFTIGDVGQITLQPDSGRDGKFGHIGFPPSGTFLLVRIERDESGQFFGAAVAYFSALFRYLFKKTEEPDDPATDEAREACITTFRAFHARYAQLLLRYKFTIRSHERDFFEFLYQATMKVLRSFFGNHRLHGVIEDIVNKLFRSQYFRFNFKKQQVVWDTLSEFLHQGEKPLEDPDVPAEPVSPSPTLKAADTTANAAERRFTQLVCPPKRISLKRAMQSRSCLMSYKYPDVRTTIDLLAEKSFMPRNRRVPSAGSGVNAARTRSSRSMLPSPVSTVRSHPSVPPPPPSSAGASRASRYAPAAESTLRYLKQVEEHLMPHDHLEDIYLPLEALSDHFKDMKWQNESTNSAT